MNEPRFRVFDPEDDVLVVERRLPHWAQPGTLSFITFRSNDSMPRAVIEAWLCERNTFLRQHNIDPCAPDWHQQLDRIPRRIRLSFQQRLSGRWQRFP